MVLRFSIEVTETSHVFVRRPEGVVRRAKPDHRERWRLIVVLGESTRLPPSLVWELAYGELVFHPMEWHELSPDHLLEAIADFARRQRRFGGIDDDT